MSHPNEDSKRKWAGRGSIWSYKDWDKAPFEHIQDDDASFDVVEFVR
jgi:hypothetical protein